MPLFEGHDLTCIRGERCVFAELSFALAAGGALVLTGPNGSGKSSLLRLMAGLLSPAQGMLLWDGAAVGQDPEAHRGRLAYLGHLDAVKPVLTVGENLAFWAGLEDRAGVGAAEALAQVDLLHLSQVPGRLLSAGQKRRLALARVLAGPAELWLLDEPTVGLDRDSIARLMAALAAHRDKGGQVVAATHARVDLPGAETLELDGFAASPDWELAW
jgi:heme exporter protein A